MMDPNIEDFLKYDYSEAKDLAKAFLTLVSAILVGTITFSEKIVDFQKAARMQRSLVMTCWVCLVLAIVCSGIALVFDYNSALAARLCGAAVCGEALPILHLVSIHEPYRAYLFIGNNFMLLAGGWFAAGLLLLVISAIVAVKSTNPRNDDS